MPRAHRPLVGNKIDWDGNVKTRFSGTVRQYQLWRRRRTKAVKRSRKINRRER